MGRAHAAACSVLVPPFVGLAHGRQRQWVAPRAKREREAGTQQQRARTTHTTFASRKNQKTRGGPKRRVGCGETWVVAVGGRNGRWATRHDDRLWHRCGRFHAVKTDAEGVKRPGVQVQYTADLL